LTVLHHPQREELEPLASLLTDCNSNEKPLGNTDVIKGIQDPSSPLLLENLGKVWVVLPLNLARSSPSETSKCQSNSANT